MANIPDGFWKAALRVGGLATVALFVFWSLYDKIINKLGLSHLGETNTMIFVVLMAALIFVITLFGMSLWYLNSRNKGDGTVKGEAGVMFEVPHDWTFRTASTALAQAAHATITFEGFEESELNTPLRAQKLSFQTTLVALERLGNLASTPIRPYRVTKKDGLYQLSHIEGTS